jgi:uncharacterized protein (DUF3084 family)
MEERLNKYIKMENFKIGERLKSLEELKNQHISTIQKIKNSREMLDKQEIEIIAKINNIMGRIAMLQELEKEINKTKEDGETTI